MAARILGRMTISDRLDLAARLDVLGLEADAATVFSTVLASPAQVSG